LVDQLAGKCSLQSCEATTPAARKQLSKFVENDDEIHWAEIAFKEFLKVFLLLPP